MAALYKSTCAVQVYNVRQAKQDIDAVYSMGLFDDVNILPQPSEDSTMEQPKVPPFDLHSASDSPAIPYNLVALGGTSFYNALWLAALDSIHIHIFQITLQVSAVPCHIISHAAGRLDAQHCGAQDGRVELRRGHQLAGALRGRAAWLHRLCLLLATQPVWTQPEAGSHCGDWPGVQGWACLLVKSVLGWHCKVHGI